MTIAKCTRCGGSAQGDSFEEASSKINHAVGLSRGVKCGKNYNKVQDVTPKTQTPKVEKPKTQTPKVEKPKETPKQSTSTKSKESSVESKSKK